MTPKSPIVSKCRCYCNPCNNGNHINCNICNISKCQAVSEEEKIWTCSKHEASGNHEMGCPKCYEEDFCRCDDCPINHTEKALCMDSTTESCGKRHKDWQQKQPKRCSCGGVIETHQGDTRDRDEWYCLECGQDFKTNPFNEEQPDDLLENWKETYAHKCGDPKCYSFSYDEIQKLLEAQDKKSRDEGRVKAILHANDILHEYAMKTKDIHFLNLIEEIQKQILS